MKYGGYSEMGKQKKNKETYKGDPAGYLENLRFQKKFFGGVDEADVWRKVNGLNERYAEMQSAADETREAGEAIKKKRKGLIDKKEILSFFVRLIGLIVVVYLLVEVFFGITVMPNNDMSPRISNGDLLFYYRMEKNFGSQNIIVFEKEGVQYIGRIVARPGESVEIPTESGLKVNGSIVLENDIFYQTRPYDTDIEYPLQLSDDEVFVLCDYRDGGKDSRYFGPVKMSEIKGKVLTIIRRSSL